LLSETAARELWPGGNAIGQVLQLTPDASERFGREEVPLSSRTFVVIGIARNVTGHPMGHAEARVYLSSPVTTRDAAIESHVAGQDQVAMVVPADVGDFRANADSRRHIDAARSANEPFSDNPVVGKQERAGGEFRGGRGPLLSGRPMDQGRQ
jgi:hypothetical protein